MRRIVAGSLYVAVVVVLAAVAAWPIYRSGAFLVLVVVSSALGAAVAALVTFVPAFRRAGGWTTVGLLAAALLVAGVPLAQVAVVSGPNLAKEIAQKQPAAAVVAAPHHGLRATVAEACAAPYFRPYTNADVVGTEIAGAVKNVIALAVGMAQGLGLGENPTATLLTRGLAETARLGAALGADPQTFLGLAGVGDMAATCS